MKNTGAQNNICLIGPASVGKSFISSRLSVKTGMPAISIDDIISFAENELYNKLSLDETELKNFKLKSLMFAGYNELSPEMKQKQESLLDEYLEKYKLYTNLFDGLYHFYEPILEYNQIGSNLLNPSTEFVVLFTQRLHLKLLEIALEHLDKPVIIDTPAPLGFKPTKNNNNDFITADGYSISISNIRNKFESVLSNCGTKVFLTPGIDYSQRNAADNNYNKFLLDDLDNYFQGADIVISVNGMFTNPKESALKSRVWLDAESNSKTRNITNEAEIANICDTILEYINELEISTSKQKD